MKKVQNLRQMIFFLPPLLGSLTGCVVPNQQNTQANLDAYNQVVGLEQEQRKLLDKLERIEHKILLLQEQHHTELAQHQKLYHSGFTGTATHEVPAQGSEGKLTSPDYLPVLEGEVSSESGQSASEIYQNAIGLLKNNQYPEAIVQFDALLASHSNSKTAPIADALYWKAEALYATNQLPEALATFTLVQQQFPDNTLAPESLLKMGYISRDLGQTNDAIDAFNALIDRYPSSYAAKTGNTLLQTLTQEAF